MAENAGAWNDGSGLLYSLKMQLSVPEQTPSMRSIRSPVATRSLSVPMTGSAAPTVASW